MTSYATLYVALVVVSGVLSAGVAVLAWRNRRVAGSVPLAVLMSAVSLWAAAKVLEVASPGVEATVFWSNVQYVGITVVPAAWLAFALSYTGRDEWLGRRTVAALAVEPVLVLAFAWTNGAHGLFRTSVELVLRGTFTTLAPAFGPGFWVHAAYSYLLLAAGTWLIVRMVAVSEHLYRSQAVGLLAVVAVPWAGNGIYLLGIVPPDLDPTIMALSVSGLVMLWCISRHRLLTLIPAAREVARAEVIERMSDAMVVVDDRDRIVDCNPAAGRVLGCSVPEAVGSPLEAVHPLLHGAVTEATADEAEELRTGFSTWDGDAYHHYDVRVSSLRRGRGLLTGRLISVRDVTERRQREQRLDVMNRLLRHNVRNDLSVVLGGASMLHEELEDEDHREQMETISAAAGRTVERADKVTRAHAESNLATDGPTDVAAEVADVAAAKRQAYPEADIVVESPDAAWSSAGPAVGTAIDELVTNAVEHSDGDEPEVRISVAGPAEAPGTDGGLRVEVADAGPGIPDDELAPIRRGEETQLAHGTGVGLWLATWVVREAGGDIEFGEADGDTTVTLHLPAG